MTEPVGRSPAMTENVTPAANPSRPTSNRTLSAPILPFVYQEVRRLTLAAHVALGCRGASWCGFPLRRPHRGDLIGSTPKAEQDVACAKKPARGCGHQHVTSLRKWMVQDASFDP